MKRFFVLVIFLFVCGNIAAQNHIINTTCSEIMACLPLCEIKNPIQNCTQQCFNQSSPQARQDLFNYAKCTKRYCSNIQNDIEDMSCSYDLCPTETQRCFGTSNATLKNCKDTGDFIINCNAQYQNNHACINLALAKSSRSAIKESVALMKCHADHCSGLSGMESVLCIEKSCPLEAKKCGMVSEDKK